MTLIEEARARQLPPARVRQAIRRAAGVSQNRMAAELGVHRSTFIRWETGESDPRWQNRERYARLLAELQQVAA